jgi:hypothetical protein
MSHFNLGGARPGAGRPKGSKNPTKFLAGEYKQLAVDQIIQRWGEIIDTKMMLALGTWEKYGEGKAAHIVYKQAPSGKDLVELIEIVIGKPDAKLGLDGSVAIPGIQELSDNIKSILEERRK